MIPTWCIAVITISFSLMFVFGFIGLSGFLDEYLDKKEKTK